MREEELRPALRTHWVHSDSDVYIVYSINTMYFYLEHVIFLGYQQNINVVASSLIFYHRSILISFSCE